MQWHLALVLSLSAAFLLYNEYQRLQIVKGIKAQFKRVQLRKKKEDNKLLGSIIKENSFEYFLQRKLAETQPILTTWWIFKLLTHLPEGPDQENLRNSFMEEARQIIENPPTSLTADVMTMISVPENVEHFPDLLKNQFLNWEALSMLQLTNGQTFIDRNLSYSVAAPRLKAAAVSAHLYLTSLDETQFKQMYSQRFQILPNPEDMLRLFNFHKTGNSQLAFALAVGRLDAILGDTFAILTEHSVIVPKKLRFTLETPEMIDALGADCCYVLACLIGPLTSLNLRNLIWHGFLNPNEFHPAYTSLLLLIMLSLDRPLELLSAENAVLRRRTDTIPLIPIYDFVQPFPLPRSPEWYQFAKVLSSQSFFVIPGHLPLWNLSWDLLAEGDVEAGLALLFPELEHSIRMVLFPHLTFPQIYVASNNCADRLLSAAADELYTTLDVLLSYRFGGEEEEINRLFGEFGEGELECLLDVLIWQNDSPRIRDKIGHGMLVFPVAEPIVARLLSVVLSLLYRHCLSPPANPFTDSAFELLANYRSVYHPKSCLQNELGNILPTLNRTAEALMPHYIPEACLPLHQVLEQRLALLQAHLQRHGYESLTTGSREICEAKMVNYNSTKASLKAVSNLRQMCVALLEFLADTELAFASIRKHVEAHKANQKARRTYMYFLERIPALILLAKIYVVSAELCLVNLQSVHSELCSILMTTSRTLGSLVREHKVTKLTQFACCLLGIEVKCDDTFQLTKSEQKKCWTALLRPLTELLGLESSNLLATI